MMGRWRYRVSSGDVGSVLAGFEAGWLSRGFLVQPHVRRGAADRRAGSEGGVALGMQGKRPRRVGEGLHLSRIGERPREVMLHGQ